MDSAFWHQRWQKNEIGFHQGEADALLVRHFKRLFGTEGSRVFVPLCGKTRDIGWLLSQGYRVAGAELSPIAVGQLFTDLGLEPEKAELGGLTRYSAERIDIFVGDIFELSRELLGPVDVIYDRAALVALPGAMRESYAAHLVRLTATAPQFLLTFAYDQSQMDGPPFSVPAELVQACYADHYELQRLATQDVAGGLKGRCAATETLWLLRPAQRASADTRASL